MLCAESGQRNQQQHQNKQQQQPLSLNDYGQFSRQRATTPHFVGEVFAKKKNFDTNPNPDFPPYVVKTLHFVELRLRLKTNTA